MEPMEHKLCDLLHALYDIKNGSDAKTILIEGGILDTQERCPQKVLHFSHVCHRTAVPWPE